MGYGYYDSPLGPAGYQVDDHCHETDCTTAIDRGLSYVCGDQPGRPGERVGCGRWFCDSHLIVPPAALVALCLGGLCAACLAAALDAGEAGHDDDEAPPDELDEPGPGRGPGEGLVRVADVAAAGGAR